MAKNLRNIGALVSADALVIVSDGDGAYMDYDIAGANARIGAKGTAGTSRGLLLRTIAAGVALTVLTFTSAGAATFVSAVNAPSVNATGATGLRAQRSGGVLQYIQADAEGGATTITTRNDASVAFLPLFFVQQNNVAGLQTLGSFDPTGKLNLNYGLAVTAGTTAVQALTATSVTIGNGQFLQATRNTGSAVIQLMGYGAGTDDVIFRNAPGSWIWKDTGSSSLMTLTGVGALTVAQGLIVTAGGITAVGAAAAGAAGNLVLGGTQQTTIGANGAASALTANPLGYLVAYVGATKVVIPYFNA